MRRKKIIKQLVKPREGLYIGDGINLFLIGKDGGIYDKSYYLSGKSGLEYSCFGIIESNKIKWLSEKNLEQQNYKNNKLIVESRFNVDGIKVNIEDFIQDGILIRKINTIPKVEIYGAFKFFPERCDESGTNILKENNEIFVISFRSLQNEKNILYSNSIKSYFGPFFEFDKDIGYPIHHYPSDNEIKALSQKFLKKNLKRKCVERCYLSPTFSAIFFDSPIAIRFISTKENNINEILKQIRNLEEDLNKIPIIENIDKAVIRMLTNRNTGFPIAAPEYENPKFPYQSSGGYGYTWFRDAMKKLEAFRELQNKFIENFIKNGYLDVPHRVWAFDGSIAPGWANGNIVGQPWNYQLDQLASFSSQFANFLLNKEKISKSEEKLLISLSNKLIERSYDDGMPLICQNCWEDHIGIFSHTAGTFLNAYFVVGKCLEKYNFDELSREMKKRFNKLLDSINVFWKDGAFRFYIKFPVEVYVNAKSFDELKKINYKKGKLVKQLDSGTFELIKSLIIFEPERFKEKIISHLETSLPTSVYLSKEPIFEGLWKKTKKIEGVVRYQGDLWRRNKGKFPEKIWSVATLEAAHTLLLAAKKLYELGEKDKSIEFFKKATHLFSITERFLLLAEQYYDDGTPDSATPLGWSHAMRFIVREMIKKDPILNEIKEKT